MADTAAGNGLTLNPGRPAGSGTGYINLARGNKYATYMGWRPSYDGQKTELTGDSSAVVASLDTEDLPAEIKKGQSFTVLLDCSVAPRQHWVEVAATARLHELFVVTGANKYPPGTQVIPALHITAKVSLKKEDIPLAAAYVMLLA